MPNNPNSTREIGLIMSRSMPDKITNFLESNAKRLNDIIKPIITPMGRLGPPAKEVDNTKGKIGKIQGEAINARPSMNANPISMKFIIVSNAMIKNRARSKIRYLECEEDGKVQISVYLFISHR